MTVFSAEEADGVSFMTMELGTVASYGSDLLPVHRSRAWGTQLSRSADGTSLTIGASDTQQDIWIVDDFAR